MLLLQGHNWVLACYMVSLIRGNMITGVQIQHMMLQGYIEQGLCFHTNCGFPNPSVADLNYIKITTNAVKKYKTVPKCKEMISDSMFHYIAKLASHASRDSLVHAIVNWIALGC